MTQICIILAFLVSASTTLAFSSSRGLASETTTAEDSTNYREQSDQLCQNIQCTNASGVFITIDKNPNQQCMKVCDNGQVTKVFPVSTGRETFDIPTNFSHSAGCSVTPEGTFHPLLFREVNYSNTWLVKNENGQYDKGAEMKNSIFFKGGVAIHAAGTVEAVAALGPKVNQAGVGSGGCVRLHPDDSVTLFNMLTTCKTPDLNSASGCAEYKKIDPQCATSDPKNAKCTDPIQFPVVPKSQKVTIQVIDSRSPEEKKMVQDKCKSDQDLFEQSKAECLLPKLKEKLNSAQKSQLEKFEKSKNPNDQKLFAVFFKSQMQSLDKASQEQMSMDCNAALYEQAHNTAEQRNSQAALQAQMREQKPNSKIPIPAERPIQWSNNPHDNPPLPVPKPKKKRPGVFGWLAKFFK